MTGTAVTDVCYAIIQERVWSLERVLRELIKQSDSEEKEKEAQYVPGHPPKDDGLLLLWDGWGIASYVSAWWKQKGRLSSGEPCLFDNQFSPDMMELYKSLEKVPVTADNPEDNDQIALPFSLPI